MYFRYIRRKGWKRFFKENILETEGSSKTKALSVALGVFVGLTPLWGFHTVIVLFLATFFRLNKIISYMCTHISFPVFLPFIIMASMWIGRFFIPGNTDFTQLTFNTELVKNNLAQFLVGNIILTVSTSAICGLATYLALEGIVQKKKQK